MNIGFFWDSEVYFYFNDDLEFFYIVSLSLESICYGFGGGCSGCFLLCGFVFVMYIMCRWDMLCKCVFICIFIIISVVYIILGCVLDVEVIFGCSFCKVLILLLFFFLCGSGEDFCGSNINMFIIIIIWIMI